MSPEARQGKNRVHPGIVPDGSQTEELAWLEALGARVTGDRRLVSPEGWVVLAAPEGNESGLESAARRTLLRSSHFEPRHQRRETRDHAADRAERATMPPSATSLRA